MTEEELDRRHEARQKEIREARARRRAFWENLTDEELERVNEAMRKGISHVKLRGEQMDWMSASHNGWIGKGRRLREIIKETNRVAS